MPVDGETALIVSDGDDHERRRRLVAPAFGRREIDRYAETIRRNADRAIDSWHPGSVVDLYREFRQVIRRSTIEVLFGQRLAADEPELGRQLEQVLAVVGQPPPQQRLGLPSWRRARAARKAVERRVRAEIGQREARPEADPADVLTLLVGSRDEDGSGLSHVEIVDQVISLIAAGYETTSAAMGWATRALLAEHGVWEQAYATLPAESGGQPRSRDWTYLDGVVSETLRLYPPAVVSARKVAAGFEFMGRSILAGEMVLFSPYVTHRLPEVWPRPLAFDPARWDPSRPGYQRATLHEFLSFGGGPHRCLGASFATLEMAVLLEQLVRRSSLRLEPSDLRPVGLAAMRPRQGPLARVVHRS